MSANKTTTTTIAKNLKLKKRFSLNLDTSYTSELEVVKTPLKYTEVLLRPNKDSIPIGSKLTVPMYFFKNTMLHYGVNYKVTAIDFAKREIYCDIIGISKIRYKNALLKLKKFFYFSLKNSNFNLKLAITIKDSLRKKQKQNLVIALKEVFEPILKETNKDNLIAFLNGSYYNNVAKIFSTNNKFGGFNLVQIKESNVKSADL